MIAIGVVLAIIVICRMVRGSSGSVPNSAGAKYIMFGTTWCGWTKKQLDVINGDSDLKSQTTVIYCDDSANKQMCQSQGITGYPTWKNSISGAVSSGFKKSLADVQAALK